MRLTGSRQLMVLAALGVVLVAVVLALRSNTPAAVTPPPSNPARVNVPAAAPVADVKLELLKTTPAELDASTRNPFQFKAKVAPPPPPRPPGAAGRGAPVIVAPPPPLVPQGPP